MNAVRLYASVALPCAALLVPTLARATTLFDGIRAPAGRTLSAVPAGTKLTIVLTLPLRDAAGAARYGAAVSDPANTQYGHYLTPAEFGTRFGGDAATYEYLRGWAAANGLIAGERTDAKIALSVSGTAGQFARLFHTSFASFQTDYNGDGRVTLSTPRLPAALTGRINGVVGLSSGGHYAPLAHVLSGPRAEVGTGYKNSGYSPSDFRTAYDVPAQTSSAQTEVVGVFEQGGFKQSEMTTFEQQYNLPNTLITAVSVNGSSTGYSPSIDLEVTLDVQTAIGQNPAIKQIVVYSSTNSNFSTALIEAFNTIGQANVAKVINISYGLDEAQQGASAVQAEGAALVQLQTQGQSVFVSSGDQGAGGREGNGLHAPDPGSQPLVTSVGGTTLNTVTPGGPYASETVWNDGPTSATGGGVSSVWAIPSYQIVNGKSVALRNGGSATMRNVPDVAADADPNTGASVYCTLYGGWVQVGGTSLSAPLWTAWGSIVNADRVAKSQPRIGFLNPQLYSAGLKEGAVGFHDITIGNNGTPGFTAGVGYDNTTGFGSIDVARVISKAVK